MSGNLLTKVAQKDGWLLGYLEIDQFMLKTAVDFIKTTCGNIWAICFTPTSGQTASKSASNNTRFRN